MKKLALFIALFLILNPLLFAGDVKEGDIKSEWNLISQGINSLRFEVKLNSSGDVLVPIQAVLDNSNVDLTGATVKIKRFMEVAEPYEVIVYDTEIVNGEEYFDTILVQPVTPKIEKKTNPRIEVCYNNVMRWVEFDRGGVVKKKKDLGYLGLKTTATLTQDYNDLTIVKGETVWRVEITDLPVALEDFGWGSEGEVKLMIDDIEHCPGWKEGWLYRMKITVNSALIPDDLTDIPFLLVIPDDKIDDAKVQNNGEDARPTDENSSDLYYQIEQWDETQSDSYFVWMKIPILNADADDRFYLFYDNSGASDAQDTSNVWSSDYKSVLHMNQTLSTEVPIDSTGNHTFTRGGTFTDTTIQHIGRVIAFDGTEDYIYASDDNDWDIFGSNTDNWTIDLWVKHTDHVGQENYVTQRRASPAPYHQWWFAHSHDKGLRVFVYEDAGIIDVYGGEITDSNWHHVAMVKVADKYGLYLDGVQTAYTQDSSTLTVDAELIIGATGLGITDFFQGCMDEVRICHSNIYNATPVVGLTDVIPIRLSAPDSPIYTLGDEEEPNELSGIVELDGVTVTDGHVVAVSMDSAIAGTADTSDTGAYNMSVGGPAVYALSAWSDSDSSVGGQKVSAPDVLRTLDIGTAAAEAGTVGHGF